MPTLRYCLSGQKMLSKLYSSWVPLAAPLLIAASLPSTTFWLTPTNIIWAISQPRGGRGMTGKTKVVKVLSPWRPKRPEISFKTVKFSRNWRTGIGEYRLAALAKWPSRVVESRTLPRMGQAGRLGAKPRSRESPRRVAALRTSPGSWSSSTVSPWLTAWSVVDYRVEARGGKEEDQEGESSRELSQWTPPIRSPEGWWCHRRTGVSEFGQTLL